MSAQAQGTSQTGGKSKVVMNLQNRTTVLAKIRNQLRAKSAEFVTLPTDGERRGGAIAWMAANGRTAKVQELKEAQQFIINQQSGTANDIMLSFLKVGSADEKKALHMEPWETWSWLQNYGEGQRIKMAVHVEQKMNACTLTSCDNDMAKYLEDFYEYWTQLQECEGRDKTTQTKAIQIFLVGLGVEGEPGGQYRELAQDLLRRLSQPDVVVSEAIPGLPFVQAKLIESEEMEPVLIPAQAATPDTPAVTRPSVTWEMVKDEFETAYQTQQYKKQLSSVRDDDKPATINITTEYTTRQLLMEQNKTLMALVTGLSKSNNANKKKKKQICFSFRDNGVCQYGNKCRFVHEADGKLKAAAGGKRERPYSLTDSDGTTLFHCVDGGANTHAFGCSRLYRRMKNTKRVYGETVMMNAKPSPIHSRGDLDICVDDVVITLKDAVYVPESNHNIISISRLVDEEDGTVSYTKTTVIYERLRGQPVRGVRIGGLYYFTEKASNIQTLGAKNTNANQVLRTDREAVTKTQEIDTGARVNVQHGAEDGAGEMERFAFNKAWAVNYMKDLHARLHVGRRKLRATVRRDQKELRLSDNQLSWLMMVGKNDLPCRHCMAAKVRKSHPPNKQRRRERRKKHVVAEERESEPERKASITVDAAGPNTRSLHNNRYMFVAVQDDHSFSEVGHGLRKNEIDPWLRENWRLWKHSLARRPTQLNLDRGGETNSQSFADWCNRRGLFRRLAASDSHGGSAEKRFDSIQTIGRAMRNWAECPEYMWEEADRYANEVIVRVPSAAKHLNGLSPYEHKYKKKPDMNRLKPFGCVAFAHKPDTQRKRMGGPENRGRFCMFVGLPKGGNPGFRLYDPQTKSFFTVAGSGENGVAFMTEVPFWPAWLEKQRNEKEGRAVGKAQTNQRQEKPMAKVPVLPTIPEEKKAEEEEEPQLVVPGAQNPNPAPAAREEEEEEQVLLPEERDRRSLRPRGQSSAACYDPSAWDAQFAYDRQANILAGTEMIVGTKKKKTKQPKMKKRVIWRKKRTYGASNPLPSGMVPQDHLEALTGEDKERWRESMFGPAGERANIERMQTMRPIPRQRVPRGRKLIKAKWVFAIKKDADGNSVKWKSRLTAKGFLQVRGRDYGETFSPTPALATLRLIICMALGLGFRVHHNDVSHAFLYSPLPPDQRVYMEPPPGLELDEDYCYELLRCLYGLKQSAHLWNENVDALLKRHGFETVPGDECAYLHRSTTTGKIDAIIGVHVDDVILACPESKLKKTKAIFSKAYDMKDLGELSWYLGMKVEWSKDRKKCFMSQSAMIQEILEEHHMGDCNRKYVPARKDFMRIPTEPIGQEEQRWLDDRDYTDTKYRSLVGALQYLSLATRPDVAFSVGQLARFVGRARRTQWNAAKQILSYLAHTIDYCLVFSADGDSDIVGYADADYAGNLDDRSSTSGYAFLCRGGAIAWASKKQKSPARSSAESEIMALDLAVREARWLRKLSKALGMSTEPTTIHEDNSAAIAISAKHRRTQRTKHIDVQYFAVCNDVKEKRVAIEPVASEDNVADIFTKGLERTKFEKFRHLLGVRIRDKDLLAI